MKRYLKLVLALMLCTQANSQTNCDCRIVYVTTATQLQTALTNALPGDDIVIAAGTYYGKFIISKNGAANHRIKLTGKNNVIFDAQNYNTGYALYVTASYWDIGNLNITNGLKGIMTDSASYNNFFAIKVYSIGEEGIHLRKFSKHNVISNCTVYNTGLKTADYGEGIYIGSAKSNWTTYTNGLEDRCDSNTVFHNTIGPNCKAECVDIKEGTTGGIIKENNFDATGISGANSADSWIDIKGNYYTIESNNGYNPIGSVLTDGYQVHCTYTGWGNYNEFKKNFCSVNATGYAVNVSLTSSQGTPIGNKVYASNIANSASSGLTNIIITP
jgi:hypothetical protein